MSRQVLASLASLSFRMHHAEPVLSEFGDEDNEWYQERQEAHARLNEVLVRFGDSESLPSDDSSELDSVSLVRSLFDLASYEVFDELCFESKIGAVRLSLQNDWTDVFTPLVQDYDFFSSLAENDPFLFNMSLHMLLHHKMSALFDLLTNGIVSLGQLPVVEDIADESDVEREARVLAHFIRSRNALMLEHALPLVTSLPSDLVTSIQSYQWYSQWNRAPSFVRSSNVLNEKIIRLVVTSNDGATAGESDHFLLRDAFEYGRLEMLRILLGFPLYEIPSELLELKGSPISIEMFQFLLSDDRVHVSEHRLKSIMSLRCKLWIPILLDSRPAEVERMLEILREALEHEEEEIRFFRFRYDCIELICDRVEIRRMVDLLPGFALKREFRSIWGIVDRLVQAPSEENKSIRLPKGLFSQLCKKIDPARSWYSPDCLQKIAEFKAKAPLAFDVEENDDEPFQNYVVSRWKIEEVDKLFTNSLSSNNYDRIFWLVDRVLATSTEELNGSGARFLPILIEKANDSQQTIDEELSGRFFEALKGFQDSTRIEESPKITVPILHQLFVLLFSRSVGIDMIALQKRFMDFWMHLDQPSLICVVQALPDRIHPGMIAGTLVPSGSVELFDELMKHNGIKGWVISMLYEMMEKVVEGHGDNCVSMFHALMKYTDGSIPVSETLSFEHLLREFNSEIMWGCGSLLADPRINLAFDGQIQELLSALQSSEIKRRPSSGTTESNRFTDMLGCALAKTILHSSFFSCLPTIANFEPLLKRVAELDLVAVLQAFFVRFPPTEWPHELLQQILQQTVESDSKGVFELLQRSDALTLTMELEAFQMALDSNSKVLGRQLYRDDDVREALSGGYDYLDRRLKEGSLSPEIQSGIRSLRRSDRVNRLLEYDEGFDCEVVSRDRSRNFSCWKCFLPSSNDSIEVESIDSRITEELFQRILVGDLTASQVDKELLIPLYDLFVSLQLHDFAYALCCMMNAIDDPPYLETVLRGHAPQEAIASPILFAATLAYHDHCSDEEEEEGEGEGEDREEEDDLLPLEVISRERIERLELDLRTVARHSLPSIRDFPPTFIAAHLCWVRQLFFNTEQRGNTLLIVGSEEELPPVVTVNRESDEDEEDEEEEEEEEEEESEREDETNGIRIDLPVLILNSSYYATAFRRDAGYSEQYDWENTKRIYLSDLLFDDETVKLFVGYLYTRAFPFELLQRGTEWSSERNELLEGYCRLFRSSLSMMDDEMGLELRGGIRWATFRHAADDMHLDLPTILQCDEVRREFASFWADDPGDSQ